MYYDMGKYVCELCGDDFPKPGVCELHGEPLVKMEEGEKEDQEMFGDDEEYN